MNNAETLCHSSGPWKKHKYFQKIGEGAKAVYKYKITGEGYKENAKAWDETDKEYKEEYEYFQKLYGDEWKKLTREQKRTMIYKSMNPNRYDAEQGFKDALDYMDKEQKFNNLADKTNKGLNATKEEQKELRKAAEDYVNAGVKRDRHRRESEERAQQHERIVKDQEAREQNTREWKDIWRKRKNSALKSRKWAQENKRQEEENYRTKSLKGISETQISKGRAKINEFFSKSKPKVTVTDTFTGKKRTPKKPKSSSDTVNIKELSKKNKKK